MSYRTILVHLDDTPRTAVRVGVAAQLARMQASHLIGLAPYGLPPASCSARTPASAGATDTVPAESPQERAHRVSRAFVQQAKGLGVESLDSHADSEDAGRSMIQHAACTDLLVIGQSDYRASAPAVPWVFPPQVVLGTGRPVLVIPADGEFATLGSRVVIAWNGRREARRAILDALPLLRAAASVQVLQVDEQPEAGPPGPRPPTEHLLGWLARHGIFAELGRAAHHGRLGRQLLHKVAERGADLLVMGGCGHFGCGDVLLGSATRAVLAEMKTPVLMSH